ncbi:hypothetical protein K5I29_04060 [Flavobacterium agricola]|uniref:Uncharacterized protein n=1 Tax=Flavobacterium agricola TaxID=2870839 RepID=A0ABY6M3S2_9FLAO|nr:hypothetical protein [Flavobacterium agricola]UYW02083.1 hypothetical protein K5I29_04060 [Flavobacterium agricola]
MINAFIEYLKNRNVFEGRVGNFNSFYTEILFQDHYFQLDFDFIKNKVKVAVWVEIDDEDFIQVGLDKKEMSNLINYLENLQPKKEEEPIKDLYSYYGVQPQNFI